MSIEAQLAALTAAVEANTAALKAGSGATAGKTTSAAGKTDDKKGAAAGYKAKHTKEELVDIMGQVKDKHGTAACKDIVGAQGHAKMAEIVDPKKIDAAYALAEAKLEEDVEGAGSDDDI